MIIWADGFDIYGTGSGSVTEMLAGLWAAFNATTCSATQKRTGSNSLAMSGTVGNARRVFGGAKPTAGLAGALFLDALPTINKACAPFIFCDSANAPQVTLELQTTGAIAAWLGHGNNFFTGLAVLLGTSTTLVTASSWNHLEAKVIFDPAAGAVEVRLNGVTILNLTGVCTVNSSSPAVGESSASQMTTGFVANNSGRTMYLDDLILWDGTGSLNNDFVGDQKVFTDFPNADTADIDWTPSSGSNRYSRINEAVADDDTSYDTATVTGNKMGVTFPALDAAVVSVSAVVMVAKTKKTDAGTANVQLSAKSGASVADGADNPITTAYTYRLDVFEEDPATSAPWVPAAAGAAALVIERTA